MLYRVIDADKLSSLVRGFMNDYEVIAPVKRDQGYVFPSSMIPMKWSSTTPPRSLHLRNSSFLQKKCSCASMQRRTRSPISRSILSRVCSSACIRATSTRSIGLTWCTKTARIPIPTTRSGRENTLIVGLGCMPGPACFCNLCGTDEARMGTDMFLQKIGDKYLVSLAGS